MNETTQRRFSPGDIVRLKSGGPLMTVKRVEDADATCTWFWRATAQSKVFDLVQLEHASKPDERTNHMLARVARYWDDRIVAHEGRKPLDVETEPVAIQLSAL